MSDAHERRGDEGAALSKCILHSTLTLSVSQAASDCRRTNPGPLNECPAKPKTQAVLRTSSHHNYLSGLL